MGRLLGARVVYVESVTRIDAPSLSCRLIRPVAERVYVQWPELLEPLRARRYARQRPRPRVIFVTLGTHDFPFDRLLRALDRLPGDEELVVQTRAPGVRPAGARRGSTTLPYDELAEDIRRARVVVCHAGVGSVLTALANGKRPVVVPRLARFGEAVDDHQLAFARRLGEAGAVTLVEDVDALPAALAAPPEPPPAFGAGRLAADLRQTLERLVYSR